MEIAINAAKSSEERKTTTQTKNLIIFDCDGVLIDSEFLANKIFTESLINYGYTISIEDAIKRFTGLHEHECRELIMKEAQIDLPHDYWARELPNLFKTFELE